MAVNFGADPEELKRISSQVNSLVNDYKAEVIRIYEHIEEANQNWSGAAKQDYVNKANECKPDLDNLGTKIDEYANWLATAAGTISQMDASVRY